MRAVMASPVGDVGHLFNTSCNHDIVSAGDNRCIRLSEGESSGSACAFNPCCRDTCKPCVVCDERSYVFLSCEQAGGHGADEEFLYVFSVYA